MATATAACFEDLEQRGYEPALRTVSGMVRFEIEGEGSWQVAVSRGAIMVVNGEAPAHCTVAIAADDFVAIVRGTLDPLTAALQGRVHFTGNAALALVTLRIFRCPCA